MSDGTFTQADLDRIVAERLTAQKTKYEERIALLTGEVKTAREEATKYEAAAKRLPEVEAELTGIKTAAERAAVWSEAGVPEPLRPRLEKLWQADGADKPLADWLTEARESDPVVQLVFAQPAGSAPAATASAAPGSAPAGSRPPATAANGKPPQTQAAPSIEALRVERARLTSEGKHAEARKVFDQILAIPQ